MGVETPIPPITIYAAAPAGAFAAASTPCFPGNRSCPAVPYRGPEAGSPPKIQYLQDFHGLCVNSLSCAFLQSKKTFIGAAAYIATTNRKYQN
jgi:hypothetical protein